MWTIFRWCEHYWMSSCVISYRTVRSNFKTFPSTITQWNQTHQSVVSLIPRRRRYLKRKASGNKEDASESNLILMHSIERGRVFGFLFSPPASPSPTLTWQWATKSHVKMSVNLYVLSPFPLTECRYHLCKIKYFKTEQIKQNTDKTGQNKGIASAR